MKNIYIILGFVFIMTVIESFGLTLLTKHSIKKNYYYLFIASLIYGIVIPFFILKTLKHQGIGTINLLWNIMSTIVMITIGYYMFYERFNHLHLISFLLGISSITILYLVEKK